jgi:hypothetical protein
MDIAAFDALMSQRTLGMVSINDMGQKRLESRLKSLRDTLRHEYETGIAEEVETPSQHVVLMAALPFLWETENEESGA